MISEFPAQSHFRLPTKDGGKSMKIKRILSMVLALVLSIGAMSITAFAAEETMYGIGFVNASSLRLRSEPDANSATLVYAPAMTA